MKFIPSDIKKTKAQIRLSFSLSCKLHYTVTVGPGQRLFQVKLHAGAGDERYVTLGSAFFFWYLFSCILAI